MSSSRRERNVKARHDPQEANQFERVYRKKKQTVKRMERGTLVTQDEPESEPSNSDTSFDDDVEDSTYMPTPPRPSHNREAESSRAAAQFSEAVGGDDIMEEGEEDEEVFDVDEPVAAEHIEYGNTTFQVPQNPSWRQKVNYKGNVEEVRKMRAINFRIAPK